MSETNTKNSHQSGSALRLIDVNRRYCEGRQYLHVLRDVCLSVMPGEMVALVAPSGTGKSTLLHIAGLLEKPDSGQVIIGGRNNSQELNTSRMTSDELTLLRRDYIGFIYQSHHLLPEFTALENIMIPQLIRGLEWHTSRKRAEELLSYMSLSDRASHKPSEMSGGECQRIAIARAVANVPDILLADEPTGNLDPKSAFCVFEALEALVHNAGLSAVVATHNAELVDRMDRKITLHEGHIEEL